MQLPHQPARREGNDWLTYLNCEVERPNLTIGVNTIHLRGVITFGQIFRHAESLTEGAIGRDLHHTESTRL